MGLSRRRFTREFKITAVRRLRQGESVAALARALEVNPSVLHRWREEFQHGPGKAFPGSGRRRTEPDRVAQLERKVGQQALEIDFLKGYYKHRGAAATAGRGTPAAIHGQIEKQRARGLTVKRMCELGQVSRGGFYRSRRPQPATGGDVELRDALQRVALEFPSYGRPRMTPELRRRGWVVNHKRVYRMMREDNLLCLRRRKFVRTTDSAHPFPVYPNLARGMAVTHLDQLSLEVEPL